MTTARSSHAQRTFKVTRRFSPRVPFRKPRRKVAEIVQYAIAVAANAADVQIHEFGIEANRVRLVLSATDDQLAAFMGRLDDVASQGSEGGGRFWRRGIPFTVVPLTNTDAIVSGNCQQS